jgi:hypothetical protein
MRRSACARQRVDVACAERELAVRVGAVTKPPSGREMPYTVCPDAGACPPGTVGLYARGADGVMTGIAVGACGPDEQKIIVGAESFGESPQSHRPAMRSRTMIPVQRQRNLGHARKRSIARNANGSAAFSFPLTISLLTPRNRPLAAGLWG